MVELIVVSSVVVGSNISAKIMFMDLEIDKCVLATIHHCPAC